MSNINLCAVYMEQIIEGGRDIKAMVLFLNFQYRCATRMISVLRTGCYSRSEKPAGVQNFHSNTLTKPGLPGRSNPGWGISGLFNIMVTVRLIPTYTTF